MALAAISEVLSHWIDSVCDLTASLLGRFASPRTVRLVEENNNEFVLQVDGESASPRTNFDLIRISEDSIGRNTLPPAAVAGNHIELILRSDRFLFRPLELPNRAVEFLPGIVRSQIDRLTPWNVGDTAFGWSEPVKADAERMIVTIAATILTSIRPYIQAIANIGVHSIAVFTIPPEVVENRPIKVWEQKGQGAKGVGRLRQVLVTVLAIACITAGVALGADVIAGTVLTAQQDELARQISGVRSAAGMARGSMTTVQRALERRKHDAPSATLVLETLSKILPDQTYVTELRLEGNKLRLTGITRDAPSLIGLIERSGRFTRASFFAPTTRSPSDSDDRFHIEAVIKTFGPTT